MKQKIMNLCILVMIICFFLLRRESWTETGTETVRSGELCVALSQAEPATPWKTAQIISFQNAAKRENIELIYHEPEENTLEWQLQDIRELMDIGADFLVLVPLVAQGYDSVLEEAQSRGIPVILLEQELEMNPEYKKEDYYLTYVAPDYFREGELCADILSEVFGIQPCHAMVIQGDKDSFKMRERHRGFMHGIRNHSNLYISKRVESNGNRLTAQKATELLIADQEIDFNAVFAPSDEDGLGALQALKLSGVKPGKEVLLVSIGGVQDVVKAMISEEYLAAVKSQADCGDLVMGLIRDYNIGQLPPKRVLIPNEIYALENAEESLEYAY